MAKKKKKKDYYLNVYRGFDMHHIFYQQRFWNIGYLKALRLHPYCSMQIPRDSLHRQIHSAVKLIPTPKPINAKEAIWHLNLLMKNGGISEDDKLEKRLNVLIALFDCIEQPTADALRKQLEVVRKFYNKPS